MIKSRHVDLDEVVKYFHELEDPRSGVNPGLARTLGNLDRLALGSIIRIPFSVGNICCSRRTSDDQEPSCRSGRSCQVF